MNSSTWFQLRLPAGPVLRFDPDSNSLSFHRGNPITFVPEWSSFKEGSLALLDVERNTLMSLNASVSSSLQLFDTTYGSCLGACINTNGCTAYTITNNNLCLLANSSEVLPKLSSYFQLSQTANYRLEKGKTITSSRFLFAHRFRTKSI